ncbi:uncharacterized protein LOC123472429 [Daphnia magna]|uniref:uncharacterized protein LOC123472429 n=1 Tax=Daphnia magna TaxID=35525 RepID=UPI001E1BBAD0|nr:uncharacterized protein LOC123472429 [Daphnia magna]
MIGYTDGSIKNNVASCAFTFPDINLNETWLLSKGSNIQTAELYGILKALEACNHHYCTPPELHLFTDSQAALLAIDAIPRNVHNHHPVLIKIWNMILGLKGSGTITYITWIPSHVGILGNEMADTLASDSCNIPLSKHINNPLSTYEKIALFKKNGQHLL